MKLGNKFLNLLAATTVAGTLSAVAFADNQPSTSTANADSVKASSVLDKLSMSYTAIALGAPVATPFEGRQPNIKNGGLEDDLLVKNYIGVMYKVTKEISVGPVAYWSLQSRGKGLTLKDPYLKASNSAMIKSGNFSLYSDARLSPGVTDASVTGGKLGYLGTKNIASYDFPNSRFSVNATGVLIYSQFTNRAKSSAANLNAEITPGIDYKASDSATLNVYYDANAAHARSANATDWTSDGTSAGFGVSWDLTKKLNINPFIDMKVGERVALDTTTWNAVLAYKLF